MSNTAKHRVVLDIYLNDRDGDHFTIWCGSQAMSCLSEKELYECLRHIKMQELGIDTDTRDCTQERLDAQFAAFRSLTLSARKNKTSPINERNALPPIPVKLIPPVKKQHTSRSEAKALTLEDLGL